ALLCAPASRFFSLPLRRRTRPLKLRLSPFLATLPENRLLSLIIATLPKTRFRKSFVCHTCDPLPPAHRPHQAALAILASSFSSLNCCRLGQRSFPPCPIFRRTCQGAVAKRAGSASVSPGRPQRSSQSLLGRRELGPVPRRQEVGLHGGYRRQSRRKYLGHRPLRCVRLARHQLRRIPA